jgi:sterol desaturase/sphingolipid hydroxylase (fatty acid hydroxylase superfamily)
MEIAGSTLAYAIGIPAVIALILLEAVLCQVKNWDYYKRSDTLCSLGLLAGNTVVGGAIKGGSLALSFYLYQFRILDLSAILPLWALWFLSFVAIDFVFYWWHRMSHRVHFLWAIHMSHHCSEEMNFVVAFRQPWLAPIFKIPFFAVLPLAGFDPTITVVAGIAATLWGVVGHTQIVHKLWRPIEWLFNTPSHHRVHHGSNPEYIDKNYGNLFIVWDRMFGTFQEEQAKVVYGLRTNVGTSNPFRITFMDWASIFSKMSKTKSLGASLGYFFGPPDWKPHAKSQEAVVQR